MDSYIKAIDQTLNHKLSMSNMELYHSNLLARVLEKYKEEPFSLLEGVVPNYKAYRTICVERESKHKDLTIILSNGNQTITVIIENKFKSLPKRNQLEEYTTDDSNMYYILLSLTEPEKDILPEKWCWKNYDELSKYYTKIAKKTDDILFKEFLKDYVRYISAVSKLLNATELDMKLEKYYIETSVRTRLKEIGLIDLVDKIRHGKMSNSIKRYKEVGTCYFDRISGGFYFGYNYEINEYLSFDVQIQGNQYRHKLNIKKSIGKSKEELIDICEDLKTKKLFFTIEENDFLITPSRRRNKWNKYESDKSIDLYDYKRIVNQATFKDLITYINNQIKILVRNSKEIENLVMNEEQTSRNLKK